jgi:hypothetical protein
MPAIEDQRLRGTSSIENGEAVFEVPARQQKADDTGSLPERRRRAGARAQLNRLPSVGAVERRARTKR